MRRNFSPPNTGLAMCLNGFTKWRHGIVSSGKINPCLPCLYSCVFICRICAILNFIFHNPPNTLPWTLQHIIELDAPVRNRNTVTALSRKARTWASKSRRYVTRAEKIAEGLSPMRQWYITERILLTYLLTLLITHLLTYLLTTHLLTYFITPFALFGYHHGIVPWRMSEFLCHCLNKDACNNVHVTARNRISTIRVLSSFQMKCLRRVF